jgi:DNA mismatch repair protein MutS2
VRLPELAKQGTVVAVEGGRVVVNVGGVRMRVDSNRVATVDAGRNEERGARKRGAGPAAVTGWSGVAPDPATELDLRGQRADEAEHSLVRALDEASVADLRELRVIHGKGTGALRERVTSVLDRDGRVENYRAGKPAEGGYGVTLVRMR